MERVTGRAAANTMLVVGILQGVLLLWLWKATEGASWPATEPMLLGALLGPALTVPLAWYLSENTGASVRWRLGLLLVVALVYAAFGAYAGWLAEPFRVVDDTVRWRSGFASFAHMLAALVLGFVALTLVLHRRTGLWHYPLLFELAWRNAMLCISAAVLASLFWMVLFAGAMLFKVIGMGFLRELITQSVFVFPVTALVVAEAFALGHRRAALLADKRRFPMTLMAWLLPMLLGFSVVWVAMLPFAGVGTLFSTGHAAAMLLWFTALAVHFLNCAWQDGEGATVFPVGLNRVLSVAWWSLLPVVVIAGWALWLRIAQYGLTEERVWAVFVWLLALLYVGGYALSVFRAGRWLGGVGTTNIVVAVVMCAGLAVLVSPLADPRRLAVQDQVGRLLAGEVEPEKFDYLHLYHRTGRWGRDALESLAALDGGEREREIAQRAQRDLDAYLPDGRQRVQAWDEESLRKHIEVLAGPGDSAEVPASLYQWLLTAKPHEDWGQGSYCQPDQECLLWMADLDGDGVPEAVLLTGYRGGGWTSGSWVLTYHDGQWTAPAMLQRQMPLQTWRQVVREGRVTLQRPHWPNLMLGGELVPSYPRTDGASAR